MSKAIEVLDAIDVEQRMPGMKLGADALVAEEPSYIEKFSDEIDGVFGDLERSVEEMIEAVSALAEKKESEPTSWPNGENHWAVRAKQELALASPTSLAVTLELLRKGRELPDLKSCIEMEYRVATNFLRNDDLKNGISAVLKRSREGLLWKPPPSAEEVEKFFVAPIECKLLRL